ncbi:exocyst complex component Sec10 [Mongoliitalea lutea]|nr:exocyst complex component Sec10 [Mongoliitalea lutea]
MKFNSATIIIPLLMLGIFAPKLHAQQEYKGEYRFNGLNGEATFRFIEGSEGKIIKQGDFSFTRKERDGDDKTRYYITQIAGIYDRDVKSGLWDYLEEDHQIEPEDIVDFKLIYDLQSSQIKLKANYKQGVPDGRWVFEENEFTGGELRKKAQADEFLFSDGDIKGKFQFKSFVGRNTHFIRGELKDGGIMHGEWTFVYEKEGILISEVRNYENGFLLGIVQRDLRTNEVLEEIVFFETIRRLNQINAGQNKGYRIADQSFDIYFNDGFLSSDIAYQSQSNGNQFMSDFLVKILRYDDSYVNADRELIEYPIHTKKFVFELSRSQQRLIEEIPEEFERQRRVVRDYSNRNSLRINRQRSDSLAFANAYFDHKLNKLNEFTELVDLLKSKRIQYYDVQEMYNRGIPFIKEKEVIEYRFNEEVRYQEVTYDLSKFETDFYGGISDYFNQMAVTIRSVKGYVDESLSKIERDDDLRAIENRIQVQKLVAEELYQNLEGLSTVQKELVTAVYENILVNAFEEKLKEYSQLDLFTDKKQQARVVEDMLEQMIDKHEEIVDIPNQLKSLDKLYEEEVFNPFTFSRYDQRAKPRLFEAGEKLFEHYIVSLKAEKDYAEVRVWLNKIQDLSSKMKELREADTRRLENRINRRLDVKKIESLLDL